MLKIKKFTGSIPGRTKCPREPHVAWAPRVFEALMWLNLCKRFETKVAMTFSCLIRKPVLFYFKVNSLLILPTHKNVENALIRAWIGYITINVTL